MNPPPAVLHVRRLKYLVLLLMFALGAAQSSEPLDRYREVSKRLVEAGLRECEAHAILSELVAKAPHRLSGSPGAATAVGLARRMMLERGFESVRIESLMVPRWVRGSVEEATILGSGKHMPRSLHVCALGGSVATPNGGIAGQVLEVKSFDELKALGTRAKGKIIFFNRPMDPTNLNTFEAYGRAADQRSRGAIEAARMGAVAALVRSLTLALDTIPHTGAMSYADGTPEIPAAAISTIDANMISALLGQRRGVRVRLRLGCRTFPDVPSANVLGEIRGSEFPRDIIVVGGHLDSWDKGTGAHDDGSGCAQAIEVLNLIKRIGVKPRRTIRAVLFMNEENGTRGGKAYAKHPDRSGERHIAAIESDRGGFTPRGFSLQADSVVLAKVLQWKLLFSELQAGWIERGGSGVDVGPLVKAGTPGFGLLVDDQRYFDYHHSENDTVDKVHPRELELGAIVQALLAYLISEEGLRSPLWDGR